MGQKVNPHGIRVGVIKDWDSRWFASKKDFSDNLVEDHKIRTELKAQLKDAGVPKIEIERTVDPSTSAPRVTVNEQYLPYILLPLQVSFLHHPYQHNRISHYYLHISLQS